MKRKLTKLLAIMLIFGFFVVSNAVAGETSITGTVHKTDKGVVISADDGNTYNVMGADLTEMVGKAVKATGTLAESADGKVLTLISVEPVQK
jgi:hypothetical protein